MTVFAAALVFAFGWVVGALTGWALGLAQHAQQERTARAECSARKGREPKGDPWGS